MPARVAGAVKQADGDNARQKTDDPCEHDQTPVVRVGQAGKHPEHGPSNDTFITQILDKNSCFAVKRIPHIFLFSGNT
jgi:hypothetical protein